MSIVVKNLSYVYNPKSPYQTQALHDVSFTIEDGQFVGLCGHTGSGKSTFVQHLNALVETQQGALTVDGLDLTVKNKKLRKAMLKQLRGKVGMVFQYPEYQLFANTVYEDVAFGPKNMQLSAEEIDGRVKKAIASVGLDYDYIAQKSPFELSGGEKRRVALAGVLAMDPVVLVLDEPTAGLDPRGKREILNLVVDLNKNHGLTVVMISHDMNEVYEYTDRTIVFNDGTIAYDMPTYALFKEVDTKKLGLEVPQMAILNNILAEHGIKLEGQNRTVKQMLAALVDYRNANTEKSEADKC